MMAKLTYVFLGGHYGYVGLDQLTGGRNSANERKRRQVYRSEVHKQLPFEPRGMEEPAPALEINTTGSQEPEFSITRDDLIGG